MKELALIRSKKYRLRRVGARSVAVAIPQYYLDRYKLDVGGECLQMIDENGNLVLVFPHSKDWIED